jgi:hypothetical protein
MVEDRSIAMRRRLLFLLCVMMDAAAAIMVGGVGGERRQVAERGGRWLSYGPRQTLHLDL